jgi:hypothetical protein
MAAPDERDHYRVLGVPRSASQDQIRRAHRQLAQLLHPDRLGGAGPADRRLAERRMREVNAAWTVLSDPARRAAYDQSLRAGSAATPPPPGGGRPPGPSGGQVQRPEDADDPDAELERRRRADVDPDEPELPATHFWLLRRGPLVLALVVAVVLFVATAYAGPGRRDGGTTATGLPLVPDADCVRFVEGRNAIGADCSGDHDGRIVARVDAALDCPAGSRYALLNNRFVCVRPEGGSAATGGEGG